MNIKRAIIKTNDVLAYIAFVAVAVVSAVLMLQGQVGIGAITMVIGWIVCCLVFGVWFVLSSIADNVRVQTDLMRSDSKVNVRNVIMQSKGE
ncbi:hypothetical protein D3C80_1283690 [compost metagenome]